MVDHVVIEVGAGWVDVVAAFGTAGAAVTAIAIALWEHFRQKRRDESARRAQERADLDECLRLLRAARRMAEHRKMFDRPDSGPGWPIPYEMATSIANALIHHSHLLDREEGDDLERTLCQPMLTDVEVARMRDYQHRVERAVNGANLPSPRAT